MLLIVLIIRMDGGGVLNADNLDFKWIDLEEKDERTVAEILEDMQEESDGIAAAVERLQTLLGGIQI